MCAASSSGGMLRRSLVRCVRYQPYALAVQTRFRWRHKETDRWRRLMDATCFAVDWLGQTRGRSLSHYSGHWTHLVTCAHVICPWDYPNYYPTEGPTRFVSRITLADTMTQVRVPTLEGHAMYRHFTSNHHVYVHSNPRLDLCVVHPEINLRRAGEMHMVWLQNEGYALRPRLELTTPLRVGDRVWVYGMRAHESLFDDVDDANAHSDPRMVPTGIAGVVRAITREHFFVDTLAVEGDERGCVHMGMCGSVVMRHGRCVGMLTATVHRDSPCTALAGTAMCTHAADVFEFLLEVEKQMKTPVPSPTPDETPFQQRRRDERVQQQASRAADGDGGDVHMDEGEYRDWGLHTTRLARHVRVPQSLWHMEESWVRDEGASDRAVYGRSSLLNQEVQENMLGFDMTTSTADGTRPRDAPSLRHAYRDEPADQPAGTRRDTSPRGIYVRDTTAHHRSDGGDGSDNNGAAEACTEDNDNGEMSVHDMLHMAQSYVTGTGSGDSNNSNAAADARAMAEFGLSADDMMSDEHKKALHSLRDALAKLRAERAAAQRRPGGASDDDDTRQRRSSGDGGNVDNRADNNTAASDDAAAAAAASPPRNESATARKKRERREQEAAYQRRLRERLGEHGEAGEAWVSQFLDRHVP